MYCKKLCILIVSAMFTVFLNATAHAFITKVIFNAYSHHDVSNTTTPRKVQFEIVLSDSAGLRGPNAVDFSEFHVDFSVGLIAGGSEGITHHVTLNDWEEWSGGFYPTIAWDPAWKILDGATTCQLTLKDKAGRRFTMSNKFNTPFLNASPITAVPTNAAPRTLKWSKVSGALYYKIRLKDATWGEPVYWHPKPMPIYIPTGTASTTVSYTFPTGVIRTGHNYSVQIEAVDSDTDIGRRSRSLWVGFTGP